MKLGYLSIGIRALAGWIWTNVLILFAFSLAVGNAKTFTNREGKTIEAEISTVREGKVHLVQGGQNFAVDFGQLSDADQDYVRKWVADNFVYNLNFQSTPTEAKELRQSTTPDKKQTKFQSTESEVWKYDVKVTNRSGVDLADLRVEYLVVVRAEHVDDPGQGKKTKTETPRQVRGIANIAALANTGSGQFTTVPITLNQKETTTRRSENRLNADREMETYYWWDNTEDQEVLDGIWVRLYKGDRMIGEWKSPGKLIKDAVWK